MNIYQKMSAITAEIGTVAKNLNVGIGKGQYKAVGEADVLAAVKPAEQKYGVYSFPLSREIVDSGELVSSSVYNGQTTEKKQLYMRVKTIYRFVNMDDPNEYIDIATYGDGVDPQDKAPGKAMTYGDKYALLKAYKIQTGDDPDQNYSEPLVSKQKPVKREPQRQEPAVQAPAYPSRENMLKVVERAYPKASKNHMSLLAAFHILDLSEISDAQLMAVYNKVMAKKANG